MDPLFENIMKGQLIKMNPDFIEGLVKREMDDALHYLDRVFRSAFSSLGSNVEYVGYRLARPDEEYRFKLKRNGGNTASKARYELARSDLRLAKFDFLIDGKATPPLLLYVPYCDETGLMHLRGTSHTISAVVEDPGVSITQDGCFFRVTCDKIVIRRTVHTICKDEINIVQKRKRVQKHINIPYGKIYRAKQQKANTNKNPPMPSLPHYLFAKFGVTEAFRRFARVEVAYGNETDITPETHPDNEWTRYYSTKTNHPNNKRPAEWAPTTAAIAIRQINPSNLTEIMVAGYFYVADCYPHEFAPGFSDEPEHWRLMMGKMVFNRQVKHVQMSDYLRPHFESLDTYLDAMAKENLAEEGIVCEDIYEVMVYIIANLDTMINTVNLASVYGKKLAVLPYVLSPIVHGIFYTKFNLMQQCKQWDIDTTTGERTMRFTEANLFDAFNRNLKPEVIYKVKGSDHGEISSIAAPGDNKLFKINNKLVLQQNASGGKGRPSTSPMSDDSKSLDVSIATANAFLHITKPDPSGRSIANLYNPLPNNRFVPPTKHGKLFDTTQALITRRNI